MKSTNITWTVVTLVGLGLAAFVGIFALIPENEPTSRTALLSVISVASSAIVTWFINRRVNEVQSGVEKVQSQVEKVQKTVNGNTQSLIAKLPDPVRGDQVQIIRVVPEPEPTEE